MRRGSKRVEDSPRTVQSSKPRASPPLLTPLSVRDRGTRAIADQTMGYVNPHLPASFALDQQPLMARFGAERPEVTAAELWRRRCRGCRGDGRGCCDDGRGCRGGLWG